MLFTLIMLSNTKLNFNSYIKNFNSNKSCNLRLKLYNAELRIKEFDLQLNYINYRLNKLEKQIYIDENDIINNNTLIFYKK